MDEIGQSPQTAVTIKRLAGCDHVTLLAIDVDGATMRRILSTAPVLFAPHGTKPVPKGRWVDQVITAKSPVLFAGATEIRAVFQDHRQILGHGIHAILNIPVIRSDRCAGSVNCLYVDNPAPRKIQTIARSVATFLDDPVRGICD